jgi:NADH:ubiquinone reductase (non-electrogenic)
LQVKEKSVVLQLPDKSIVEVPCGLVIWAAGNKGRKLTQDLMAKIPNVQSNRRGITVDGMQYTCYNFSLSSSHRLDFLHMLGTNDSIFAVGDCTATSYAPTAQVASQQGAYLARLFKQLARKDSLQAKLNQLQETAAGLAGEEKKKVEAEIDGVTKQLAKSKLTPFHYSHQGSLALVFFFMFRVHSAHYEFYRYIGSDKAIADLPFMNGNVSFRHP